MSSSAFPIFCAIFAFLCGSLISISAEKNSTAPIYVRYVRRRPPWFPGDLYVEEVVEEFRTKGRPPMFGSSEDDIQQFLERDQKLNKMKEKKRDPVKWDKRNNSALRKMIKAPIEELKPTITVTIYKPSDRFEMRVKDVNTASEPWATTMKVPYTNVMTKSAEIDYYDLDEGGSYIPSTLPWITTTTKKPIWKPFGQPKIIATIPTTTTTTRTLNSMWVPFGVPTLPATTFQTTTKVPNSFWMPFSQTKTTTTPLPSTTETTEKPWSLTTSTTTQRPYNVFNLFGKSTVPASTTETPVITTSETESFEEPTNTELSHLFPESTEKDITNATEEVITDNSLGVSTEVMTSTPAETEGSDESITTGLDDDYVNGEIVDSIEEDHTAVPSLITIPTSTEEPEEVATTARKSGLFGWLG